MFPVARGFYALVGNLFFKNKKSVKSKFDGLNECVKTLKKESTGFEPARPLNTGSPDFESGALPLCQLSITATIIQASRTIFNYYFLRLPWVSL